MNQKPIGRLDPILSPQSIAVIGASRAPNTIGHQIVRNLIDHGFTGPVFPVNPNAASVCSIPCAPSVADLSIAPDLAVIAVPAARVIDVAKQCGASGVQALVVISAGFREIGGEGVALEQELVDTVRRYGMRMVGPNCMGVLNTDPAVSMNATFSPVAAPRGRLGFMSQSGALGIAVIDRAADMGLGLSSFVSVGNKADISGNDLLQYWEQDDATDVALLYLESF